MSHPPALVIGAHGTRLERGQQDCRRLAQLVAEQLPGVEVRLGHVELVEPHIDEVVAELLGRHEQVVVTPLMLGTGAHVQRDIPEMIGRGALATGHLEDVTLTPHLGAHPKLLEALDQRIASALAVEPAWQPAETMVVLVGRGSLVAQANADHVALTRLVRETHELAEVLPGFIQVTTPDLPGALDRAALLGARRVVVAANFLFTGRLDGWVREQTAAWGVSHPDVELRVAEVIGPCVELAAVVAERYRDAVRDAEALALQGAAGSPMYLSGLNLRGRRVLVAGGGAVATRRLTRLLEAGALVEVVAPRARPQVQELAAAGRISWQQRPATPADITGAWYVLAATDDPEANQALAEAAEAARVFCVRADDAHHGTAWTPATETVGDFTVGVLGNRDPRGSVRLRQRIIDTLTSEEG
ncbi:CbiX/SirB N-terminal domain-containing protein [Luteococcus sp. H138]|uniref:CbiX/SirB N-terminal domain-containing protein n=1 Tax=unclassified Luteococcus TaxID=2639923 RepID=UPI00313B09B7